MAAHRYWGLRVGLRATSVVGLADVEMRATSGGANQATGGVAASTSGFSYGGSAAAAFDSNTGTAWYWAQSSVAGPPRLSYDFLAPVDVAEIVVTLTGAADTYPGSTQGPGGVWVEWSDNGVDWHFGGPVSDLSAQGNSAVAVISAVTDTPPVARYVGTPLRVSPGVASGPSSARVIGRVMRNDLADGGAYRVAGTVAIDGTPAVPVRRRVRLFHRLTGRLIRETWSALDGTFAFEKIALAEYLVVSDDYTRVYNAVVADAVVSVP